jgi:hypothetical protein
MLPGSLMKKSTIAETTRAQKKIDKGIHKMAFGWVTWVRAMQEKNAREMAAWQSASAATNSVIFLPNSKVQFWKSRGPTNPRCPLNIQFGSFHILEINRLPS